MEKYALIRNNTVVEVTDLSDDDVSAAAQAHELVIAVGNLLITPAVGWVLSGNQLVPAPGQQVAIDLHIKSTIKKYQEAASELLRDLYTQNTLLGITNAQSDQMFDDYQDVLLRIREGAWPTALYRLSQKQPAGFVTQSMIDGWATLIQSRMQ
jgi:hypothetical protein